MTTHDIPADLNGDMLTSELAAAGISIDEFAIVVSNGQLEILGDHDQAAADIVVQAHEGGTSPFVLMREERAFVLTQAVPTLRQWAADAEATTATNTNAVQVLNVVIDRLGVFFDRFADLLENQYGTGA